MLSDQIRILKEKQKELQTTIDDYNTIKKAAKVELIAISKAIKLLENLDDGQETNNTNE